MIGGINWQVMKIWNESGINHIGQSKHAAKSQARADIKGRPATWHTLGKKMGIHSYATADAYRDVWRQLGRFVRSEFKVRDFEKITGEHVQAYLEHKIGNCIALSTFRQYAAACEKLESALNGFAAVKESGISYSFTDSIRMARDEANTFLRKTDNVRSYKAPSEVIKHIKNAKFNLVARMQYEGGFRVSETNHLTKENLRGLQADPVTGEQKGVIHITAAKGGFSGDKYVSPETYRQLEKLVQDKRFEFNKDVYRKALKGASEASGQRYNGSHGLRWNFARERFQEVQRHGLSYDAALSRVSNELFHHRADITEHYLK